MADNIVKRLLDAGVQVTEMSQARAEQLVKDLQSLGGLRRRDAERTVNELVSRGRSTTEAVVATVQREIATQVGRLVDRMDGIESVLTDVATRVGVSVPTRSRTTAGPKKAAGKKATPKKAAGQKAAPKKNAAKKTAAKKTAAKKTAAKKTAARR